MTWPLVTSDAFHAALTFGSLICDCTESRRIWCRSRPMSIQYGMGRDEHDEEGRLITAEYPYLYVVNAYVPNSGDGLKRLDYRLQQWDVHFAEYLQQLAAKKPVVLTGDLNCCHQEIDIHAPKKNLKSAGFTRVCFARALISMRHACRLLLQTPDADMLCSLHALQRAGLFWHVLFSYMDFKVECSAFHMLDCTWYSRGHYIFASNSCRFVCLPQHAPTDRLPRLRCLG